MNDGWQIEAIDSRGAMETATGSSNLAMTQKSNMARSAQECSQTIPNGDWPSRNPGWKKDHSGTAYKRILPLPPTEQEKKYYLRRRSRMLRQAVHPAVHPAVQKMR